MSTHTRVKQRFQAALKQQSGGLLGLSNVFHEIDNNKSGKATWEQFCTALQKCGLAPSPQDLRALFLELDTDGKNEISYEEFIKTMRGDLSTPRRNLITRIFECIDNDNDGIISMTDIGRCFNPRNHPDVKAGRVTVSNFINTFFDSFCCVSKSGYVSLPQFIEYYANASAFEDDAKFFETMKSLWNVPQDINSSKPNSRENTLSKYNYGKGEISSLFADSDPGVEQNMEKLRQQLIARGARGIVGLQRKFRIVDDDGSKSLNMVEFKKAIRECALNMTDLQLSQLFGYFDKDRSGTISFDEFIQGVRVRHLYFQ